MALVKPFHCLRPKEGLVSQVAALPYDVYSREEACQAVMDRPLSFLNIDRAETQFSAQIDTYADVVYEKAKTLLQERIEDGTLIQDTEECYYIYELTMDGRSQIGLVACSATDDYESGVIKKHEKTRAEKEQDRIRHVDTTNAHTGPIFLAYRSNQKMNEIVDNVTVISPLYDFVADDGIRHQVWKVSNPEIVEQIKNIFAEIPATYIADGHHRAASAVKVGQKRRLENPNHHGSEEYNFFLSVLFPDDQLMIMPYNRVVKDLNGMDVGQFLEKVKEVAEVTCKGQEAYAPTAKKTYGMYLEDQWYELKLTEGREESDPVKSLDVSLLQDYILDPILDIGDPRTDNRIDFIGGIRGLTELEERVHNDMKVAFSLHATSIKELFDVADAGLLMPPKSTWFEPKLRSGLFIHLL